MGNNETPSTTLQSEVHNLQKENGQWVMRLSSSFSGAFSIMVTQPNGQSYEKSIEVDNSKCDFNPVYTTVQHDTEAKRLKSSENCQNWLPGIVIFPFFRNGVEKCNLNKSSAIYDSNCPRNLRCTRKSDKKVAQLKNNLNIGSLSMFQPCSPGSNMPYCIELNNS